MNSWKIFFKAVGSIFAVLLIIFATYFTSWAITTGFIWIVCQIGKFTFTIGRATAIWLILVVIEKFIKGLAQKIK